MRERAFGVGFHNSPAQPCAYVCDVAGRFRAAWHTTGVGRKRPSNVGVNALGTGHFWRLSARLSHPPLTFGANNHRRKNMTHDVSLSPRNVTERDAECQGIVSLKLLTQ
jgi:hypothetical protein